MCSVRRFRAGQTGESGKPSLQARCPYAGGRTAVIARVQSLDAPRSGLASSGDLSAVRFSVRQENIEFASLFFGPSKRGPPAFFL